mmetsp:Transcript_50811/g.120722  ORF Transcript_50811/g.120722 Transcript_50811/m.120722 type:complete len:222 (-) Transcript_50811:387-1052(-)
MTDSPSEVWRGQFLRFYQKDNHSHGYIQCLEAADNVYFYAMQLIDEIYKGSSSTKDKFSELSRLTRKGRFVEFAVEHTSWGPKAVPPITLLPETFEGHDDLASRLGAARKAKRKADQKKEPEEEPEQDPDVAADGSAVCAIRDALSKLWREQAAICTAEISTEWSIASLEMLTRKLVWEAWNPCDSSWKGLRARQLIVKAREHFGVNASPVFPCGVDEFVA